MRSLKELLSFGKIRNKFLYITLAIGTIPLIVVGSLSFLIATRNVQESSAQLYANNLGISNSIVNILSKNVESLARSVLGNQRIKGLMDDFSSKPGGYPDAQTVQQLDAMIAELTQGNNHFSSLFLMNEEDFRYQYTSLPSPSFNIWRIRFSDIQDSDWYRYTVDANGKECYFLYDVLGDYAAQAGGASCLSTTKLLKDTQTGRVYGVLIINMFNDYYRSVYPAAIQSEDSRYLLADPKSGKTGYLWMHNEQEGVDIAEGMRGYPDALGTDGYSITRVQNQRTGWDLIHVIEDGKVIAQGFTIPLITALVILVLVILSVICSVVAANTITSPLKKLNLLMDNMEDAKKREEIHFQDDEIGRIGMRFQMMISQNEQLNQKVVSLSTLEKEAELNALQAQINPHFFYNTLATMYWLAKFGKNSDVADIAISLSDIFKIALKRGSDMITVAAELEHIQKYIRIQNIRYQNRIQFSLDVPEEMMPKRMLKLLLQPLVENAIYHGLETKTGDWRLSVSGRMQDGKMVFTIEDNGVGMAVEGMAAWGVGIQNVVERIRLKYGEGYGCHFESEPGSGTRVTVTIPEQQGEC